MRITPMDIRQQQFTVKMFRGFDAQEVDTFLEDVAQDYEALVRENALLKEQLQALEERARGLEERERVLQETLVTTQRLTEEMRAAAKRQAELTIREAEVAGEKLMEAARAEEAVIRQEILRLRRTRRELAEGIRSTVQMYQRLAEHDLGELPAEVPAPGAPPVTPATGE